MDTAGQFLVYAVVAALLVAGLLGAVLPFLPGAPLILAGALLYAIVTDFTPVGWGRLAILGALTVASFVLDCAASALGARRFGGSRWAVGGAVAGALVGVVFGPPGLLLGPVVGAVAGELLRGRELRESVRTGIGAAVGVLAGAIAKLGLALAMVALFLWWLWRG
jgi:uncharacterized protein YqgC (DUF456 family)